MVRIRCLFVSTAVLLCLASLGAPLRAQETDTRPGIAVFEFENGGSISADALLPEQLGVGIQLQLTTELIQNSGLRLVERGRLQEVLDELELSQSDLVDPTTAAQLGKVVGARYFVFGAFVDFGEVMSLPARITDIETTEQEHGASVEGPRADLLSLIVELADRITQEIDLPPLESGLREARRELAATVPADAIALYSEADADARLGNVEGAIRTYELLVDRYPEVTLFQQSLEQLKGGG
jgi:hypothetical protein